MRKKEEKSRGSSCSGRFSLHIPFRGVPVTTWSLCNPITSPSVDNVVNTTFESKVFERYVRKEGGSFRYEFLPSLAASVSRSLVFTRPRRRGNNKRASPISGRAVSIIGGSDNRVWCGLSIVAHPRVMDVIVSFFRLIKRDLARGEEYSMREGSIFPRTGIGGNYFLRP